MEPVKIGPPKVAPEDSRSGGKGPRQVRCHQCHYWEEWRYVVEKGAIEGNPVAGDLECWWCYIQRIDPNLKWGDVKPLFKKLIVKPRNHRVQLWQDLLSYVTCPENEPAKEKLKGLKHAFDDANAQRIAFETSDGGSSSMASLDIDADVKFQRGDQYVGINKIVYEGGTECLLFNWASRSNNGNNVGMATLVKATGETITKGRSLEGQIAAHNLCVVSDTRAITELQQRFDPDQRKYLAFGIGGESE